MKLGADQGARPTKGPGLAITHFVARVALLLRAKGITRVRPLEGGIDAWLADNFPFRYRKPRQETRYPLREGIFPAADAVKNPQC